MFRVVKTSPLEKKGGEKTLYMNIKDLMQKMHGANTDEERGLIKSEIEDQFSSLSDSEKEEVRKAFINSWDEKNIETKELLDKVGVYIENCRNS